MMGVTRTYRRGVRRSGFWLRLGALTAFCAACVRAPAAPTVDPTIEALVAGQAAQATLIQAQGTFISYLATIVPRASPVPSRVPVPTPFVSGAVSIEDGRCCLGATAGTPIQIAVAFEAASPLAPVTEMRVRAGGRSFDETEMADVPWEPFRSQATYPFVVPLNWVGFYVTAQFRDALQNPSAVVHDDLSVEGMPASPSLSPTP
jgi:hypothetical protein